MNRKIFFAVIGIVLCAVLFIVGCELSVNDPVRAIPIIEPYISVQPLSYSYFVDEYTGPPTLRVTLYDWEPADGNIRYQWYTFDTVEQYCAAPIGGRAISGATSDAYTPSGISPEVGKSYYYYAIVTNNFADGTDRTRATIQSELAIISFAAANASPFPVITRHPTDATYTIGRTSSISPLEVRAEPPIKTETDDEGNVTTTLNGTVSYQWYSNTTFSTENGTAIIGATQPTLVPDTSSLARGPNYFYVEVSNTVSVRQGANTVALPPQTLTLLPVIITMRPGEKAEAPRIEQQPKDQVAFNAGEVVDLTVVAVPLDGGTLSYQWYSLNKPATTFSGTGSNRVLDPPVPQIIDGATGSTYTPPVTEEKAYYRVIVTNTNNDVTGDKTATSESKIVTIAIGTGTVPTANAIVTIRDPTVAANRQQYIRGYGGMDVAWLNFPGQYMDDTEMMHNPDWGLGFNIMRIMIVPPGSSDGNYIDHETIITKLLNSGSYADNNFKGHYIENVKIVNKYNGYVLASPWTPPKEWKSNNSINSGGHLLPQYYQNFATYLRSFCQYMYYQGAPVYAVSIANEPNYAGGYDGCEWDDGRPGGVPHMRNFWKEVGHFTDGVRGFGGGKSIPSVLTVNGESANNPDINFPTLNDPEARAAVDFYARHVYGEPTKTLWSNPYADYKEGSAYQTECWMTEHNINSATASQYPNDFTWNYIWRFMNDVDLVIRINNENAFVWWANKRFYSYIGDGVAGNINGAVLPRGYGLSHYAKYTIDKTRININVTGKLANGTDIVFDRNKTETITPNVNARNFNLNTEDAKITAFVSQDGNEISMVMFTPTLVSGSGGVNLGVVQINMPDGFEIGSAQAVRSTSATRMMVPEDVIISSDRKSAYVTLPVSNLLSLRFTRK